MSSETCLMRFLEPMNMFKYGLLIPPVNLCLERDFFVMNLFVPPLQTSLNESNLDRLVQINVNGLKS